MTKRTTRSAPTPEATDPVGVSPPLAPQTAPNAQANPDDELPELKKLKKAQSRLALAKKEVHVAARKAKIAEEIAVSMAFQRKAARIKAFFETCQADGDFDLETAISIIGRARAAGVSPIRLAELIDQEAAKTK